MITMRDEDFVPCKHCGKPTAMKGTRQCDRCWEERRSGALDVAENRIRALEAELHNATLAATQNKELGDHHFQRCRALEAQNAALLADVNQDEGYERLKARNVSLEAALREQEKFTREQGYNFRADKLRLLLEPAQNQGKQ